MDETKRLTPLAGKRILVTRARAQAADLCNKLAALGAEPIPFPTIEIAPLEDCAELDEAIRSLEKYRWIIFTSVNGVSAFWKRLELSSRQSLLFADPHGEADGANLQIAAIGPATAKALSQRGAQAQFVPEHYVAERLLDGLSDVKGQWVLLPRADIAREALAVELANRGAVVHEIVAYRTLPATPDPLALAELQRGVDVITFTSSSTVRNFITLAGPIANLSNRPAIACIGPITAQTTREVGLPVDVMATEYTMDGLVAALAAHFAPADSP
jgi:uroporphyrinogen-III synthase